MSLKKMEQKIQSGAAAALQHKNAANQKPKTFELETNLFPIQGMTNIDDESVQRYNEAMSALLKQSGLQQKGRKYFDPERQETISDNQNGLNASILNGYLPIINSGLLNPEHGSEQPTEELYFQILPSTTPIYSGTVLDYINLMTRIGKRDDLKTKLAKATIFTSYNGGMARIDGIDFEKNPNHTFQKRDPQGTVRTIRIVDYYKEKYGISIKDLTQPLLVQFPLYTESQEHESNAPIYFVPELCQLRLDAETDIEDRNAKGKLTKMMTRSPEKMNDDIFDIVNTIQDKEIIKKIQPQSCLILEKEPVKVAGTTYEGFGIRDGSKEIRINDELKWLGQVMYLKFAKAYNPGTVLYLGVKGINQNELEKLAKDMEKLGNDAGIDLSNYLIERTNDMVSYMKNFKGEVGDQKIGLVISVRTNKSKNEYNVLKKRLNEELGIPSQNLCIKSINKKGKRLSVLNNIIRTIAVKVPGPQGYSGYPWTSKVNFIPNDTIIIGIDVWHGSSGEDKSIAGIVITADGSETSDSFIASSRRRNVEIIESLPQIIRDYLNAYTKKNKMLPENIIILRDGVGFTQFQEVIRNEINRIYDDLSKTQQMKTISGKNKPALCVISVNKRVNLRLFDTESDMMDNIKNPPAGTFIPGIGSKTRYPNFYAVHHADPQHSVVPTHYTILYNDTNIDEEILKKISHQLSFMYFNWAGTIKVPAPVQNAHKLAYFYGQTGIKKVKENLSKSLFYL